MEASHIESDVTIEFLVGDLLFTLLEFSIHLSPFKSYARILCFCNGYKFFSIFGGKYDPQKLFCKYSDPQKALP
jgi:hypothetical protein